MSDDPRFYSGDFTTPVAVTPRRWEWPFPGDNDTVIYKQDFVVRFDRYARTPWDSPSPSRPDMYLTEETPLQVIGAGIGRFTRTYSMVPQPRFAGTGSDEVQPFVATAPGIGYTDPLTYAYYIDSATHTATTTVLTITGGTHAFVENDWVGVSYWVRDPVTGLSFPRQAARLVQSVTTGTVTVERIRDGYPFYSWHQIYKNLANREPFQVVVPSWLARDYFLPGVTPGISTPADIPILQPTPIIDQSTGNRTDTITDQTNPSLDDYFESLSTGSLQIAEPSELQRWHGNIWERRTRYIPIV